MPVIQGQKLPPHPVVAVVGATGAVGQEMLKVLAEKNFPASRIIALASARSAGQLLDYGLGTIEVQELTKESFNGVHLALFSAGASVTKEYLAAANEAGCIVVDNSSAYRMEDDVPLVVPAVNASRALEHCGIIANPNCSTIQMVSVLKPLYDISRIKRVVVSTYQAASGAGAAAMDELYQQTTDYLDERDLTVERFAHQIAFNCIPQIDIFLDDASTKEEWKMVVETKKILEDNDVQVAVTCVRVPVLRCHSEAIHIEFEDEVSVSDALEALEKEPMVEVVDDPATLTYPMPALLAGTDATYVGRLRKDPTVPHGLALWCVADQIRRGAALNAVEIAEVLL